MGGLQEDTKQLAKEMRYVNSSMILHCQKQCFSYIGAFDLPKPDEKPGALSQGERTCLKTCLDQQVFFDTAMYEFDSVTQIAAAQGKPKKAYFYQTRRIDDLTTINDEK